MTARLPKATRWLSVSSDALDNLTDCVVEMSGVCRTYPGPPEVPALKECDLRVRRGQMVTIVGPSGSGKSTLLNVLGLLDRPDDGTYLLDGIDTAALTEAERSAVRGSHIGFVFQAFHLLPHRTAVENVALGLLYTGARLKLRTEKARAALDRVGLADRADAPPSQLSGGERQRVAIARALVHQPPLLLCDEPTGNLDSSTARAVLDLIGTLHASGHSVVMITHDPAVADRGERSLAIRDGRLGELVTT